MGYNRTHIDISKMKFCTDETKQRSVVNLVWRSMEYRDKSKSNLQTEDVSSGPAYYYTIDAIGCSSETYRVVKPEEQLLWHELLTCRGLLLEHSRQETDFLQAVMAQKPIWTPCAVVGQAWMIFLRILNQKGKSVQMRTTSMFLNSNLYLKLQMC